MRALVLAIALCFATSAFADWRLTTVDMADHDKQVVEFFVGRSDCVKRGEKNLDLADLFGGKAGYVCEPV